MSDERIEPRERDAVPAVDAKPLMEWEEYRHAEPGELVEEDGTVMSGPAGAPQDDLDWRERRELSKKLGTDPSEPRKL
jgi:hypothetical protein